jgi:hypothetical protein
MSQLVKNFKLRKAKKSTNKPFLFPDEIFKYILSFLGCKYDKEFNSRIRNTTYYLSYPSYTRFLKEEYNLLKICFEFKDKQGMIHFKYYTYNGETFDYISSKHGSGYSRIRIDKNADFMESMTILTPYYHNMIFEDIKLYSGHTQDEAKAIKIFNEKQNRAKNKKYDKEHFVKMSKLMEKQDKALRPFPNEYRWN